MVTETKMPPGVGENAPEVLRELDFDYEKFRERLIPEWQDKADRLNSTNRGRQDLLNSDFRRFAVWNSWEIEQFGQLVANGNVDPRELSSAEVSGLYYMHSSILDMRDRVPSLELLASAEAMNIQALEAQGDEETPLKKRKLSSILEEMSTIADGEKASEYAQVALDLNKEVENSPLLETATSPRKIHAQFSKFDIQMRSLTFGPYVEPEHADMTDETKLEQARIIQLDYYRELSGVIAEAIEFDYQGGEAVSGAFGALLVLGRLRDRIIARGQLLEIEASNSFLRQDHSYRGNDFVNMESKNTDAWRPQMSRPAFDLKVINHLTDRHVPTEVKKLTNGSATNGKPGKYLPIIEVVQFRLGISKEDYLRIAKDYCDGKVAELSGAEVTSDQAEAIMMFEGKIDPELDRMFARLANGKEVATDYTERSKYNKNH